MTASSGGGASTVRMFFLCSLVGRVCGDALRVFFGSSKERDLKEASWREGEGGDKGR